MQVSSARPPPKQPSAHRSPRDGKAIELRLAALDLHRALLEAQRVRYESDNGRLDSTGKFLALVIRHPMFEWIRALSALIARLDGWSPGAAKAHDEELTGVQEAMRSLIRPEGRNKSFTAPYWVLVEAVPDVLVAHVKLWRLLR